MYAACELSVWCQLPFPQEEFSLLITNVIQHVPICLNLVRAATLYYLRLERPLDIYNISNLGLPTVGGQSELKKGSRQLQWTLAMRLNISVV